jgi:hypothetical protein
MRAIVLSLSVATSWLLAACGSDQATGPSPDTVLEAVSPAAGATGVALSAPVTVRFSGPMANGMERYMDLHHGDIGGAAFPMTCGWSSDRTTLTCRHDEPFQSGTDYTIHIGAGMMDANGRPAETESHGMAMGGVPVTGSMMGGTHAGQPTAMMGQGWQDGQGHLGVGFTFRTN